MAFEFERFVDVVVVVVVVFFLFTCYQADLLPPRPIQFNLSNNIWKIGGDHCSKSLRTLSGIDRGTMEY